MKPLSVYLHIPFCVRKCAYCDFPSYADCEALLPSYVDSLCAEISEAASRWPDRLVRTVFFGGGTPSLLTPRQLDRLLSAVRSSFAVAPDAEISMEANPGTLNLDRLAAYRLAGVNRLSIGVQAFDDRLLQTVGRIHTKREATDSVLMAHEAGFRNVNVDLMYGLPGQSATDLTNTLNTLSALPVTHVSMYSLIVEEGTPLHSRVMTGEVLPSDDETLEMQRMAARVLSARGLTRYEISNYALPGFECLHNLTYWRRGEYLGLGCAAHSLMEEKRFCNTSSLTDYLDGIRTVESDSLTETDEFEEIVMLSLRTAEGMDMRAYRRLCKDAFPQKQKTINRLVSEGFALIRADRLCLTERGMDVLNAVIAALV